MPKFDTVSWRAELCAAITRYHISARAHDDQALKAHRRRDWDVFYRAVDARDYCLRERDARLDNLSEFLAAQEVALPEAAPECESTSPEPTAPQ